MTRRRGLYMISINLADLTLVHDKFYGVITRQSSTPIGHIDLEVSCETGDNKRKEMLIFEVASFDIGYNCILRRPFLLKFMAVIHTIYTTMKMPGPKGVITIKADQRNALACESATLTHVGRFGEKAAQEQATKVAKTSGSGTLLRSPAILNTSGPPLAKKGIHIASGSNQPPPDQLVNDKKGVADKEVSADSNDRTRSSASA
jgi:hypothetical protein